MAEPLVMDLVLQTERLILRRPVTGDAQAQINVLNTAAVMAHVGGVKPLAAIEAKHAKARQGFAQDGFGFMMMIERASGELVGHCGMKRVDNPQARNPGDHEIGWLVREDRWRRGYAAEAMRAVVEWAFVAIAAPHLVALTSQRNEPSRKLMEKLGMTRCAQLDFVDPSYPPEDKLTIVYRLTPAQWAGA